MSNATQSLTIRLGLEGLAGVTAGLDKMKAKGVSAASGIQGTIKSLAGYATAGVVMAAFADQMRQAMNRMDEMSKLAQKLGDSAENISSLAYAAKLNDVEMGALQTGLKSVNEWYVKTGQSAGSMREELLQQADVFSNLADGPAKAALAVERFGESGINLLPMLNQGRAGIEGLEAEARRLGVTISSEAAQSAEGLNDSLTRLRATSEGYANKIATSLAPGLKGLADGFSHITGALAADSDFGWLRDGFSALVEGFNKLLVGPLIAGGATFTEFFGRIAGGQGVMDALRAGAEAGQVAYKNFTSSLENWGKKVKDSTGNAQAFVAALNDLERMQKLLAQRNSAQFSATSGDPRLSDMEKRARLRELNQRALEGLAERERMLQARAPVNAMQEDASGQMRYKEEALKFEEESLQLARERADLMNQQAQLGSSDLQMQFENAKLSIMNFMDDFSNVYATIANGFQNAFTGATSAISGGIESLIMGTKSWGDALQSIWTGITGSIVRAITDMAAQWLVAHVFMKGVSLAWSAFTSAMRARDVAQANATEAAKMPALAANATLASIGSWGVAVAIGLGAITAIIAGLGGFQSGGYTGDGAPGAMAGVVHRGEYVFDAPSVQRIGLDRLESIRGGTMAPLSTPKSTDGGRAADGSRIVLAHFDSRLDAKRFLDTEEGERYIVEIADKRATRWR